MKVARTVWRGLWEGDLLRLLDDSTAQRAAIIELCELLDQEWVIVNVEGKTVVAVSTA